MSLLIFYLILLLVLRLISFMDLTIAHMVLVHKIVPRRFGYSICSHRGDRPPPPRDTVFLLEGLTLALSQDTWMVHIFPIVVHVPLTQMVRYKRL
jgi:hypothetical protein